MPALISPEVYTGALPYAIYWAIWDVINNIFVVFPRDHFPLLLTILILFICIKIGVSWLRHFTFNDGYESKKKQFPSSYV